MPKNVPNADFPYNKSLCTVTMYEQGNAPDYSYCYAPGVVAGRGYSETYELKNNPKNQPITYIEVTAHEKTDTMRFNYVKIDFNIVGDGIKYFFVDSKKIINYPRKINNGKDNGWYTVGFSLRLDVWETYKEYFEKMDITLEQVTTDKPESWSDTSALNVPVPDISCEDFKSTFSKKYDNWKTIVAWQSSVPENLDYYLYDNIPTTLQLDETHSNYINDVKMISSKPPSEVATWSTYTCCNTYVVPEYFTTEKGGVSQSETLTLDNPASSYHARLDYYPYKRAYISSVDGQSLEYNQDKCIGNKLPLTITANITHSVLPEPQTLITATSDANIYEDSILFNSYPSIDVEGRSSSTISRFLGNWGAIEAW